MTGWAVSWAGYFSLDLGKPPRAEFHNEGKLKELNLP